MIFALRILWSQIQSFQFCLVSLQQGLTHNPDMNNNISSYMRDIISSQLIDQSIHKLTSINISSLQSKYKNLPTFASVICCVILYFYRCQQRSAVKVTDTKLLILDLYLFVINLIHNQCLIMLINSIHNQCSIMSDQALGWSDIMSDQVFEIFIHYIYLLQLISVIL